MDISRIHMAVWIVSGIIALLVFALILLLAVKYHPERAVVRVYDRVGNRLKERKTGLYDYKKLEAYLLRKGASYHLGSWVDPVNYTAIKIIVAAFGIFLGSQIHVVVAALLAILFYKLPDILLNYLNNRDNIEMTGELILVYSTLSTQIRSGVEITNAISECYNDIGHKNKRLYDALMVLSGDIIMKGDMEDALNSFRKKFENNYINSLCVILQQALESGQAVDLLQDVSEQLKDMETAALLRKKASLDRSLTMYELELVVVVLVLVIYTTISYMFTIVAGF